MAPQAQAGVTPAELMDEARARTGLADFGDPWFVEPLQALLHFAQSEGGLTREDPRLQMMIRNLADRLKLNDLLRREPRILDEKLDVAEKEVIEMERRLAAPEASLDAPVGTSDDGAERTRLDYMPSEEDRPDRAVANSEFSKMLRDKLEQFASTLEGREQTIFRERWLTDEPKTLQEIGDQYHVSRERARQLEKRMLDRLKKFLEAEMGTAVDIEALTRE